MSLRLSDHLRLPDRWHCLLAWGLVLLIPLLLVSIVAVPWWQRVQGLDQQLVGAAEQLGRYQQLVSALPALRAELAREQANDAHKAFYFDAATPALAGALLQSEVQDLVRAAGARPISTQILPVDQDEQPSRVRIRTQFQGTTDELLDVLYRVEEERPFLFVDQMSIRSTRPRAAPVRRSVRRRLNRAGVELGQLNVRLDIFGYSLGAER